MILQPLDIRLSGQPIHKHDSISDLMTTARARTELRLIPEGNPIARISSSPPFVARAAEPRMHTMTG